MELPETNARNFIRRTKSGNYGDFPDFVRRFAGKKSICKKAVAICGTLYYNV